MPFVCRMQQLFESDSRERAQGRGSADPTEGGGGVTGAIKRTARALWMKMQETQLWKCKDMCRCLA